MNDIICTDAKKTVFVGTIISDMEMIMKFLSNNLWRRKVIDYVIPLWPLWFIFYDTFDLSFIPVKQ